MARFQPNWILQAAVLVICMAPISCAQAQSAEERQASAESALQTGDYETAVRGFESVIASDTLAATATEGLVSAWIALGRYENALRWLQTDATPGTQGTIQYLRGHVLRHIGRYDEAERAYTMALEVNEALWKARLGLADLFVATGREEDARPLYLDVYRAFRAGELRSAGDVLPAARAAEHLGGFREANDAYRAAYQLDREHVENLYHWGGLFARKYNNADAQRTLEEALAINDSHPDALVAYAETQGSYEQKEALARKALATNPRHVRALSLLAELSILDGLYERAEHQLDSALAVNPNDIGALAHLGAIRLLSSDTTAFLRVESKALDINPAAGSFFRVVSEDLSRRYRYPDAVAVARRAVEVDRRDPGNFSAYGVALMRAGRFDEARRYLERAFDADPFDLFTGNTLTLLDTFENFVRLESANFELLIPADEADVLGALMLHEAERCFSALSQRYPYRPAGKIRIEAYGEHDDFAVRVGGIPHLGILGVAFGDVVALDTPKAQQGSDYNWARTLWHELAHTMAIGVSDFHVPRWFTEGLSVYEERRARPEWDRKRALELHLAMDQGRLLPLDEIDRGFTRPQFPGQISLSYYHASRVIAYIEQQFGFESIVGILDRLGDGWAIDDAVEDVLGIDLRTLDDGFRLRLSAERAQLAPILDEIPDLLADDAPEAPQAFASLREGRRFLEEGNSVAAEERFRQAIAEMPFWTRPGNAYEGLAAIYRQTGDEKRLVEILEAYLAVTEYGSAEARELAKLYRSRGNLQGAAELWVRSFDSDPYDVQARRSLGELYLEFGDGAAAAGEFKAALALDPVDLAKIHFDLARSYVLCEDYPAAKRAVLMALEEAPGFRDAQRLLLDLIDRR